MTVGTPVDFGGDDLYVNNIYTGSTMPGQLTKGGAEVNGTTLTSSATLTTTQSGSVVSLSAAAGLTVTLPTPALGMTYTFVIGTVPTSNKYKIVTGTTASQFLAGGMWLDVSGTLTREDGNGTSDVSINLNGTTTGAASVGDMFTITGVSSTIWNVSGVVTASGTVATPFATS